VSHTQTTTLYFGIWRENKLKIAILMHGITGTVDKFGTGGNLPVKLSHDHFKEHILEANKEHQIDVFMHSWSTEDEEGLKNLYNPINSLIEPQIIFDFEYTVGDPNKKGNPNNTSGLPNRADFGHYFGTYRGLDNLRFHSMYSKWYSAKIANELKSKYEEENGFKYDFVFLTRYDLAYIKDIKFSNYNKDKFYVIGPDNPGIGYNDLWFFSDSLKMDVFADMYYYLTKIKHFDNKHQGNHWHARNYVTLTGLCNYVEFIFNRPWDCSQHKKDFLEGKEVGPSPPVRRWYEMEEITPNSDMEVVRQNILKVAKKKIVRK
jgi:hypothetical protein